MGDRARLIPIYERTDSAISSPDDGVEEFSRHWKDIPPADGGRAKRTENRDEYYKNTGVCTRREVPYAHTQNTCFTSGLPLADAAACDWSMAEEGRPTPPSGICRETRL